MAGNLDGNICKVAYIERENGEIVIELIVASMVHNNSTVGLYQGS